MTLDPQTNLICELMPNRDCSSGEKSPGTTAADRSFCTPDCFPRRKLAMLERVCCWRAESLAGFPQHNFGTTLEETGDLAHYVVSFSALGC